MKEYVLIDSPRNSICWKHGEGCEICYKEPDWIKIDTKTEDYRRLLKIVLKFTEVTGHVPKEAITEIRNTLKKYGEDV